MGVSFSMSDVAKITGLHKNTIRNYIQRGELKGRKVAPIGPECPEGSRKRQLTKLRRA